MTFRVNFYAEKAFLSFVKNSLNNPSKDENKEIENGAVSILACVSALEAMVNSFLIQDGRFKHFDELKLFSKIETIADFGGIEIEWGICPWQDIAKLIRIRNWLAHFKDSDVGLLGSEGWIEDSLNKKPKFIPEKDLSYINVKRYYNTVRQVLKTLAKGLKIDDYQIEFLDSEEYEFFLVG